MSALGPCAVGGIGATRDAAPTSIRINHLLLSPRAVDRLIDAGIDRPVRSWGQPSDHVSALGMDMDNAER